MAHRHDSEALNEFLDALGNARRRYALYYARQQGTAGVGEMAAVVTDWLAAGSDGTHSSSRDRARVRTALHHTDLPKLSEAGLISVDRQAGTVEFEASSAEEALLDVIIEHERFPGSSRSYDTAYRGV